MQEKQRYQDDIESIRKLMERSVKFISLSGLSGILAGVYALVGAWIAYQLIYGSEPHANYYSVVFGRDGLALKLFFIAGGVLAASIISGYILSVRKSKRVGASIWDSTSKRMLINLIIPLMAGGIFIVILVLRGHLEMAAPACLVFYGLALINASPNLFEEVRYLGYSEIFLGLVAAWYAGFGLFFWAVGFGVLHIVYGALMYKKYDA